MLGLESGMMLEYHDKIQKEYIPVMLVTPLSALDAKSGDAGVLFKTSHISAVFQSN